MKKFSVMIFIIFFISNIVLLSSEYYISISSGYSSFDMSNMKNMANYMQYSNIKLPVVDNFPNNYFGKFEVFLILKNNYRFGINFRSETTGATSGLKDYSGEIKVEQILTGYSYGISYFYLIHFNSIIAIALGSELGITKSKHEIFQTVDVSDIHQKSNALTDYKNLYIQPGLKFIYPYQNFRFSLSYDIYLGLSKDIFFTNSESAIAEEWNGVRYGMMISYLIFNVK